MSTKADEKAEDIDYFKYFNEREPNSIMTVPIYSKTSKKFDLNSPSLPLNATTFYQMNFCKLPNKKLFCFRNTHGIFPIEYTCFIVDKLNNVEAIQKGSSSCYAGSIYYNGCIYVIGCFSSIGISDKFEKYDIKRKLWFKLPDINTTADRHSCDVLGNKIIYSGNTIDIFIYDIFLILIVLH
ncbi:unnamed protein product [Blepharisma stoltei]|uniref:Uncharacterized protein n=1 Tax=Blepharisma stoltei TaxID=1481888 RepID=A0AAU9JJ67_9CILI|nr:unnamed protein product [Blepharisma stoltei]